jgi:(R)-2-hydroxyacyl-CoA dehydratese activating ATPase
MLVAGVDIGSQTAKAVVMRNQEVVSSHIQPGGVDAEQSAREVLAVALDKVGANMDELNAVVATGYGRISIPFATRQVTEITCNARGVYHLYPDAKLIIDVGGQDTKVIRLDVRGGVANFAMNDKCAAGTGRYLEVIAATLGIGIGELGDLALRAKGKVKISSMCTVFAQTEVVSLIARRTGIEDIAAGVHEAIARRVRGLAASMRVRGETVLTGGVAKNIGFVRALEAEMGSSLVVPDDPQILTALGAALMIPSAG